jgi:tRNA A37 methylthiotransferase MiaB
MLQLVESSIMPSSKKLKILFYHVGAHTAWLYPAALQLKTYIDLLYPALAEQLTWLIPLQQETTDQELIEHIEKNDVDILCTSHYLWNHGFLTSQLSRVRSALKPSIRVVAGGPSIDVNNNPDFFNQHPCIDYAVFSAGEQAFADIMNHLVFEKPLIAFNTSNCAWKNNNGQTVVADYKFVKMIETSPFIHNQEMFAAMVADAKQQNRKDVWLPYNLTRGCPYACTFCDWNSGLGNKVSRRKNTYHQEIDLFQQLGVTNIYLADANVGQYDEDVDMIEYFAQKNTKENAGFHIGGNFSKLKKENNLKIFHVMARSKLVNKTFNFSIQDTNQTILNNIDRPDVGWEVHAAMAKELQTTYPHLAVKAQLIYGLPGQTAGTWRETLRNVTQQNIIPLSFLNEPLPASPAMYDLEYQRRFQFEYVLSNRLTVNKTIYQSHIPKKSSSFDQVDIVQMNILSVIYSAIAVLNVALTEHNMPIFDVELIVEDFLKTKECQRLYDNLYSNWTKDNNFYYTINFSGTPQLIEDITISELLDDNKFLFYLTKFLSADIRKTFLKFVVSHNLKNTVLEIFSDTD